MAQKSRFPTAFTILFLITAFVAVLTWVMPAGKFAKLSYADGSFLVTSPDGEEQSLPATQASLDQLGVTIPLTKFTDGDIKKPISVPGSYQTMKSQPQGPVSLLQAPVRGIEQVVDLMVFVLMIGGLVGVINKTGALDAGIARLTERMAGRERWLIVLVISLTALGGTTFGMAEETIAFYPILIPVFLAARYDALVAVAAILLGSHIGTMASTVNPFATVIASNAAGINFMAGFATRLLMLLLGTALCIVYLIRYAERVRQDPQRSLIADQQHANLQEYLHGEKVHAIPFTRRRQLILGIFGLTFAALIYGVTAAGWWMTELATLFLGVAILVGFVARMSEKTFISHFVDGARELLGVALIIGVARGVVVVILIFTLPMG